MHAMQPIIIIIIKKSTGNTWFEKYTFFFVVGTINLGFKLRDHRNEHL